MADEGVTGDDGPEEHDDSAAGLSLPAAGSSSDLPTPFVGALATGSPLTGSASVEVKGVPSDGVKAVWFDGTVGENVLSGASSLVLLLSHADTQGYGLSSLVCRLSLSTSGGQVDRAISSAIEAFKGGVLSLGVGIGG